MRDTTVKRVTTKGGHNVPGEVAPRTPKECRDCGIHLVSRTNMRTPTQGLHKGRGYCSVCYFRRARDNNWDGPAPQARQWRAADLLAEYEFLRDNHGYNRRQAAEHLGIKRDRLDTAITRARRYAEAQAERDEARDQLRDEIVAAEVEAHRINDDMIAYAIRKAVAA